MGVREANRMGHSNHPSREIADLLPAEQFAVWAVRAIAHEAGGAARICAHLARLIDADMAAEVTAALRTVTQALTRTPNRVAERQVAAVEETFLAQCWAAQTGNIDAVHATAHEIFPPCRRAAAVAASLMLAYLLAENAIAFGEPQRFAADHTEASRPMPGLLARLTAGERFVVRGARLWLQGFDSGQDPLERLLPYAARHGVSGATSRALARLFVLGITGARRVVWLKPFPCPKLSDDEAALLRAVARTRHGENGESELIWLAPAARRLARAPLESLAEGLIDAGCTLPRRLPPDLDAAPVYPTWLVN